MCVSLATREPGTFSEVLHVVTETKKEKSPAEQVRVIRINFGNAQVFDSHRTSVRVDMRGPTSCS